MAASSPPHPQESADPIPCPVCHDTLIKPSLALIKRLERDDPVRLIADELVQSLPTLEVRNLIHTGKGLIWKAALEENENRPDERPDPKQVRSKVACPKQSCRAKKGDPCRTKGGHRHSGVHNARERAYIQLLHSQGHANGEETP